MELAPGMLHNQHALQQVIFRGMQVSGSVSSVQKGSVPGWVDAGVWVDVVLIGMVVASIAGLAYMFLAQ
jgi:hypothetical protein